ncbi:transglutaminaseTgpA domain-containing protein [Demequina litorisediminis]|uniref:transglutaminaseTgpA domain-containing protein n=1 Tax=Demequina litorisediminis TaxID=1849022 RepID=UPI0024E1818A|nr:transglutaminaseTgpA domain-containing protein [Demequina litorisediminis]
MSRQAGPTPWAVTPIVAVATYAGVFALEPMVVTGSWLWTLAAVLAGVCAVVVAARLLSRSRFLPTVVGLVAALLGMVALFSRDASGARHLLPTPRALADLGSTLRAGVDYAATTVAPAEVTEALLSIICACLLLMFLVTEHIAASWRAAASAGLVLMLPWLPAAIFQQRVPIVWLFVALGAWLLSLAVSRRGEPSAPPRLHDGCGGGDHRNSRPCPPRGPQRPRRQWLGNDSPVQRAVLPRLDHQAEPRPRPAHLADDKLDGAGHRLLGRRRAARGVPPLCARRVRRCEPGRVPRPTWMRSSRPTGCSGPWIRASRQAPRRRTPSRPSAWRRRISRCPPHRARWRPRARGPTTPPSMRWSATTNRPSDSPTP